MKITEVVNNQTEKPGLAVKKGEAKDDHMVQIEPNKEVRQTGRILELRKIIRSKLGAEAMGSDVTSIVNLVDHMIELAYILKSSDIHIDPQAQLVRFRLRIDGVLQDETPLPKSIHSEIISRIKILANLRTDEHQTPQDGRFRVNLDSGDVDVRVSIVPTYYGENVVMRLLTAQKEGFSLDELGFVTKDKEEILRAIKD